MAYINISIWTQSKYANNLCNMSIFFTAKLKVISP